MESSSSEHEISFFKLWPHVIFFSSSMQGLLVVAFGIRIPDQGCNRGPPALGTGVSHWTPKGFLTLNCLLHTSVVQCMMGKIKMVLVLLRALCHGARRSVRKCDLQTSRSFVIRGTFQETQDTYWTLTLETTCESSRTNIFWQSQSQSSCH